VDDWRLTTPGAYSDACMGESYSLHAAGSDDAGDSGHVNGSLVLDWQGWTTHAVTTMAFSILAQEVVSLLT
jgi:hypothetical protein